MERVALPDPLPLVTPEETAGDAAARRARLLQQAIAAGLLTDDQLLAGIVDTDAVRASIAALTAAFPTHFEHTFAAKANALRAALRLVDDAGIGCEVASPGELHVALEAGFDPARIVYDEPAKTPTLLLRLLQMRIAFNIDNFQEYERVAALCETIEPASRIGFRINPQVGSGTIGAMSTATRTSKFGVTLDDGNNRARLLAAYAAHPWLNSLHTHVGSQGCALELMVAGIRRVVDLALEINAAAGRRQVNTIDIGGGLPVNFADDRVEPSFADYADRLRAAVPELFSGEFVGKTEFGRSLFAKNGFIAARVEYTKHAGGRRIAITHAGAQTATRTVFMPDQWAIRIAVFDADGNEKHGDLVEQDVAGPCCFAGDVIAHKRLLPRIEAGDYVMLLDTGAYYFSSPFFYNSLPAIAVYGASGADVIDFDNWRPQSKLDELLGILA